MNLLAGFCERGGRPDLPPSACHAHQEGRAVPPRQAGRQGLGLPIQQGAFQVLIKVCHQVHILTIFSGQLSLCPANYSMVTRGLSNA